MNSGNAPSSELGSGKVTVFRGTERSVERAASKSRWLQGSAQTYPALHRPFPVEGTGLHLHPCRTSDRASEEKVSKERVSEARVSVACTVAGLNTHRPDSLLEIEIGRARSLGSGIDLTLLLLQVGLDGLTHEEVVHGRASVLRGEGIVLAEGRLFRIPLVWKSLRTCVSE